MSAIDHADTLATLETLTLGGEGSDSDSHATSAGQMRSSPTKASHSETGSVSVVGANCTSVAFAQAPTGCAVPISKGVKRPVKSQPISVDAKIGNHVERAVPRSHRGAAGTEPLRGSEAMTKATSTRMPDTIARTKAILRKVRDYPITESPDWKSRFSDLRGVHLFDLAPNRPTFFPDADGHFRGQVRLTIHEVEKLPSGNPVTASQTLFALVEGHVTAEDQVTIEKVELTAP